MPADDRLFTVAAEFKQLDAALGTPPGSERLMLLTETFRDGLARTRALCTTAIGLTFFANRFGQIQSLGRVDRGLEPDDESRDGEDDVQEACLNRYDAWALRHDSMDEVETRKAWATARRQTTLIIRMAQAAQSAGMGGAALISGVESILGSMISTAYAAYETLAGDLWIEAVNAADDLAVNWADKNKDKQLSMQEMGGHSFNLSGKMGTTLHLAKKVSFQSLSDIINNYRAAFKGETDACFEPKLEIIEAEKMRHLIAHRGGVVDREFLDKLPKESPYSSLAIGSRLPLDGKVVKERIDHLVMSGAALLKLVDKRLAG